MQINFKNKKLSSTNWRNELCSYASIYQDRAILAILDFCQQNTNKPEEIAYLLMINTPLPPQAICEMLIDTEQQAKAVNQGIARGKAYLELEF